MPASNGQSDCGSWSGYHASIHPLSRSGRLLEGNNNQAGGQFHKLPQYIDWYPVTEFEGKSLVISRKQIVSKHAHIANKTFHEIGLVTFVCRTYRDIYDSGDFEGNSSHCDLKYQNLCRKSTEIYRRGPILRLSSSKLNISKSLKTSWVENLPSFPFGKFPRVYRPFLRWYSTCSRPDVKQANQQIFILVLLQARACNFNDPK